MNNADLVRRWLALWQRMEVNEHNDRSYRGDFSKSVSDKWFADKEQLLVDTKAFLAREAME